MFGYIRPLECELKVREQAEYRGLYCGLCKSIGRRYGQLERLTLSYDCAFLALVLLAVTGGAKFSAGNCGPRVYRGKRPIAQPSLELDYAADVNVLLAWYKAADDAADEKSASAAVSRLALLRAYRKAAGAHPSLDEAIGRSMASLRVVEAEGVASTDEPSDAFGRLLADVVLHAPMLPQSERAAAEWMFYNLGKWVYLVDAWDDRESDAKRGGYNPFLLSQMTCERAAFLLNITKNEAEKGYDLLSLSAPNGLLDNIMRLGLTHTQKRVLAGQEGCDAQTAPQKDKGDKE
ncbi:MAG: hypothetical protein GX417_11780 [Clostridiales bacterium]|nr:hypothetical protein [Clostridiales bacterium]